MRAGPVVAGPYLPVKDMHLAHEHTRSCCAVAIEQVVQFAIDRMHIGMPVGIQMQLRIVVAHRFMQSSLRRGIERTITLVGGFGNIMGGSYTEPVYPSVQPEADDSKHCGFDSPAAPVRGR